MNIAICEDNWADAELIRTYLWGYLEGNGFTGDIHLFASGEALLQAFAPGSFDVYFLDIYLPGISGVETAKRIRREDPYCTLIFITISPDHMREGFSLRAASYVEKPITPEGLEVAFIQCRELFLRNARYIELAINRQNIKIPLTRILYIEAVDKTVFTHLTTGEIYKTYTPLEEIERKLNSASFLRCYRSFIVNLNHVTELLPEDLLMRNGARVPVRKKGRKQIRLAVHDFFSKRLFEVI